MSKKKKKAERKNIYINKQFVYTRHTATWQDKINQKNNQKSVWAGFLSG